MGNAEDADTLKFKIYQLAAAIEVVGCLEAGIIRVGFLDAEVDFAVDDIKPRIPFEFYNVVSLKPGRTRNLNKPITGEDISDAWYIDEHWMSAPLILPNEYVFLRDFLSGVPKKVLAYRYSPNQTDRKYIYRWAERLLKRIFDAVRR